MPEPIKRGVMANPKMAHTRATLLIPNGVAVRALGEQTLLDRSIPADVLEIMDGPLAGVLVAIERPFIASASDAPAAE
jgi:hypothetical protein